MWDAINQYPDTKVYFGIAALGTLFFALRLVLMLAGQAAGDMADTHEVDLSAHGDAPVGGHGEHPDHPDSTAAFRLVSFLSILAFFMGAGWAGLTARLTWELGPAVSGLLALAVGLGFMVVAALFTWFVKRMSRVRLPDLKTCVGAQGQVYMKIPGKGQGMGQVRVALDGRQNTLRAASNGPEIPAFATVKVVSVQDDFSLVVAPLAE